MTGFSAYSLYSSSSGNSTLYTDGKTSFLIDAGHSAKKLCGALNGAGVDAADISAVFITHEHTDHISALRCFCKKYSPKLHAHEPVCAFIKAGNVVPHQAEFTVEIGDFTVQSFLTSHDSVSSVGYTVTHKSGLKTGSATDTGYVTEQMVKALDGCAAVLLESNYDEVMLEQGRYPYEIKRRIMSPHGHLSNAQASELLPYLYSRGTKRIVLGHLSPENNTPQLALSSALAVAESCGLDGLDVVCAKKDGITRIV